MDTQRNSWWGTNELVTRDFKLFRSLLVQTDLFVLAPSFPGLLENLILGSKREPNLIPACLSLWSLLASE